MNYINQQLGILIHIVHYKLVKGADILLSNNVFYMLYLIGIIYLGIQILSIPFRMIDIQKSQKNLEKNQKDILKYIENKEGVNSDLGSQDSEKEQYSTGRKNKFSFLFRLWKDN